MAAKNFDQHGIRYPRLGPFAEEQDDPTSLVALRDMLDAASPHLER
jgi:hypothetical protein